MMLFRKGAPPRLYGSRKEVTVLQSEDTVIFFD